MRTVDVQLDSGSIEGSYLLSALRSDNRFQNTDQFHKWFESRRRAYRFSVKKIPFKELDSWRFGVKIQNILFDSTDYDRGIIGKWFALAKFL